MYYLQYSHLTCRFYLLNFEIIANHGELQDLYKELSYICHPSSLIVNILLVLLHPSSCLSVCLSIYLSIYLSLSLSMYLSSLPVYLPSYLSGLLPWTIGEYALSYPYVLQCAFLKDSDIF